MTKDLYDQIHDAIADREEWSQRQSLWYTARHRGIPRRNLPYPGAPNMRFKLIDTLIEKLKPFYVQQLYAQDVLASFISLREQDDVATSAAANWFDYKLKQDSNFEREAAIAIDVMLQGGFDVLKIFWEPRSKRLCFDACDPLHIIVPTWTEDLQCADWLIHVLHYSEAQYRANSRFNQDDDFVKRIKGKGGKENTGRDKEREQEIREGITCGQTDEQIVLWECYYKESPNADWTVETISPLLAPDDNDRVAASFGLPFKHGMLPFCKLRLEIISKDHYSPRGIAEIALAEQQYISKVKNTIATWMDYHGNPTFTQDASSPLPPNQNYETSPGAVLHPGLKPTEPPAIPNFLPEEINNTRAEAEWRVAMPDFGVTSPGVGAGAGSAGGKRTATEINAIVGQTSQGTDIRARIFRQDLGDIFKMAWQVLLQYAAIPRIGRDGQPDKGAFLYVLAGEVREVNPDALHQAYEIVPNGSADSWNKPGQLQKAIAMAQMYAASPMAQFIAWDEFAKWLMEKDDPRDVRRLFRDPGVTQELSAEQQQLELVQILNDFGPAVKPNDDDAVHLSVVHQFAQARMQEGKAISPMQAQALSGHIQGHLQQMAQKKTPQHNQIQAAMKPILEVLGMLQQQGGNIIPMQPAAGGQSPQTGAPASATGAAAAPLQEDTQTEEAVNVGNMLANMVSKGVPINTRQINTVLLGLHLPPISDPIHTPQELKLMEKAATPPPPPPPQYEESHVEHVRGPDGRIMKSVIKRKVPA